MPDASLNPILNTPFEKPTRHWEIDTHHRATGKTEDGRRPSLVALLVPEERSEGAAAQPRIFVEREKNEIVNELRRFVDLWRGGPRDGPNRWPGVTPATRALLEHINSPDRESGAPRLFFAQVEALETLIFLTEVAPTPPSSSGQRAAPDATAPLQRILEASKTHNQGILRLCVKMATGSGKTAVMGAVIAWHALNLAQAHALTPAQRQRYQRSFLVMAPGITVKERLAVLHPSHPENVYADLDLVPYDKRDHLHAVDVVIHNFQRFQRRDRRRSTEGYNAASRQLLKGSSPADEGEETTSAMLKRVLHGLGAMNEPADTPEGRLCILNDEAHHCYLPPADGKKTGDEGEANKRAALWFTAIGGLRDMGRLGAVYDFSATPLYILNSRKNRPMFEWVVSDYPLTDAIEAGLVKIPRFPVADRGVGSHTDDAASSNSEDEATAVASADAPQQIAGPNQGADPTDTTSANGHLPGTGPLPASGQPKEHPVTWRNLHKYSESQTLSRNDMPPTLENAFEAICRNYDEKFDEWANLGFPTDPVLIVVAESVVNAEELYCWIGGWLPEQSEMDPSDINSDVALLWEDAKHPPFSNHEAHSLLREHELAESNKIADKSAATSDATSGKQPSPPVRTLLVHSKLESEEAGSGPLGKLITRQAQLLRPGSTKTKAPAIMREALNTVGRAGELGANVRCVVSVSMLTEGWDTKTVTHVIGFRPFGTQLLCEQVTGRALRRPSYDGFDTDGKLLPEFAEVLGVPFDFVRHQGEGPAVPPRPSFEVYSMPERRQSRVVRFPRLTGYGTPLASLRVRCEPEKFEPFRLAERTVNTCTLAGITGEEETLYASEVPEARAKHVAVRLSAEVVTLLTRRWLSEPLGDRHTRVLAERAELLRQLAPAVRTWLEHPTVSLPHDRLGWLLTDAVLPKAVVAIERAVVTVPANDDAIRQRFARYETIDPVGTTEGVQFTTSLNHRWPDEPQQTRRSHLNAAACHSLLETEIAAELDKHPAVQAWVRNYRLGWNIPWFNDADRSWRSYVPDFIVRIGGSSDDSWAFNLLVEGKGIPDEESAAKEHWAREWWIPAVCNSPQTPAALRNWDFVEIGPDDSSVVSTADLAVLRNKLNELAERSAALREVSGRTSDGKSRDVAMASAA